MTLQECLEERTTVKDLPILAIFTASSSAVYCSEYRAGNKVLTDWQRTSNQIDYIATSYRFKSCLVKVANKKCAYIDLEKDFIIKALRLIARKEIEPRTPNSIRAVSVIRLSSSGGKTF